MGQLSQLALRLFLAQDASPVAAPSPATAAAETAALEGWVRASGALAPPGLRLVLLREGAAPLSIEVGDDGAFGVSGLGPGPVEVWAQAPGFEAARSPLTLEAGVALRVELRLLSEGEIVEDSDATIITEVDRAEPALTRRRLSPLELRTQPGTAGDPVRALQALPGVARPPFSLGTLLVRGTGPEDSGFYLGGAPLPSAFHFGGLATVVHPDALSSVDLLPGAFSARHGGHIGGVVELHLDDARPAQPAGSVSIDLLQSAAQVEAPVGEAGLSFDLAARRSYADVVLSQVTLSPEEGGLLRQLPVYGDAMARLRLDGEGGRRGHLTLLYIDDVVALNGADEAANVDIVVTTTTKVFSGGSALSQRSLLLLGGLEAPLPDDRRLTLTPYASVTQRRLNLFGADQGEETLATLGARGELGWGDRQTAGFVGAQAQVEQVDLRYDTRDGVLNFFGVRQGLEEARGRLPSLALYAEQAAPVGQATLYPGLRLDHATGGVGAARSSLDPRLRAERPLPGGQTLRLGLGQYSQPPPARALLSPRAEPELASAQALTVSAGLRQPLGPQAELDLAAYRSQLRHLLVGQEDRLLLRLDPGPALDADGGLYADEGGGTTAGIEALARWEGTLTGAWLGLTLSRSTRTDRQGEPSLFAYDQPFVGTLLVRRELARSRVLGLRLRGGSGNPIPEVGQRFWVTNQLRYFPVFTGQDRLPMVYTVDLRLDKAWTLRRSTLTGSLELMNATNHANVEAATWSSDYAPSFVYGLPLLPILGLRSDW